MILPLFLALAQTTDVVLFVMDDVSQKSIATLVNRPNLLALVQEGFAFTNCHTAPLCAPGRRNLLTAEWTIEGQLASVCGAADGFSIPAGSGFFPTYFPDHAAGLFGKLHIRSDGPVWELSAQDLGFEDWSAGLGVNVVNCGGEDYWQWDRVDEGKSILVLNQYQPLSVRQEFVKWWAATPSPKLAVICPQLAHDPFHRPPNSFLPAGYPPTPGTAAKHEAMLVAIDDMIGTIRAAVDLESTILVVTADNGTPSAVSLTPGKAKGTSYDGGTNVPLIFAGVGIPAGGFSNALVHGVDILPTLLGADVGDGKDLMPIMSGAALKVHDYVLCGQAEDASWPYDVAARGVRYKLRRTAAGDQLFDLLLDPQEETDLSGSPQHQVRLGIMQTWLDGQLQ